MLLGLQLLVLKADEFPLEEVAGVRLVTVRVRHGGGRRELTGRTEAYGDEQGSVSNQLQLVVAMARRAYTALVRDE